MEQMIVMMTEVLGELTSYQVFMLGRLEVAHSNRKFTRQRAREAKVRFDQAAKDRGIFGMYEDCASSYEASCAEKQGEFDAAVAAEVSAEKFYKKCKHELLEAGAPEDVVQGFLEILRRDTQN